jgi:hypothetical protein
MPPHDIQWWAPLFELAKKYYNSKIKKTKLNSHYTIGFLLINPSKQDLRIYFDKMTNRPHRW